MGSGVFKRRATAIGLLAWAIGAGLMAVVGFIATAGYDLVTRYHLAGAYVTIVSLLTACLVAVGFGVVDYSLRRGGSLAFSGTLPSLRTLDRALVITTGGAVGLMTLTLAASFIQFPAYGTLQGLTRVFLITLSWAILASFFWLRYRMAWQGYRLAFAVGVGTAMLVLALLFTEHSMHNAIN